MYLFIGHFSESNLSILKSRLINFCLTKKYCNWTNILSFICYLCIMIYILDDLWIFWCKHLIRPKKRRLNKNVFSPWSHIKKKCLSCFRVAQIGQRECGLYICNLLILDSRHFWNYSVFEMYISMRIFTYKIMASRPSWFHRPWVGFWYTIITFSVKMHYPSNKIKYVLN